MTEPISRTTDERSGLSHVLEWLMIPLAAFPLAALATYDWHSVAALATPAAASTNWIGALGDGFAYWGYKTVGLAIWLVPAWCLGASILVAAGVRSRTGWRRLWLIAFLLAAACLLQAVDGAPGVAAWREQVNTDCAGGVFGYLLMTRLLTPLIGSFGAVILMALAAVATLIAAVGLRNLVRAFTALYRWMTAGGAPLPPATPAGDSPEEQDRYLQEQAQYEALMKARADAKAQAEAEKERRRAEKAAEKAARAEAKAAEKAARAAERVSPPPAAATEPADKGPYRMPMVDLLNPLQRSSADLSGIEETATRLVETLKLYGVEATSSYNVPGPVVTKYALELAPGTRFSAVTGLENELMGYLHAKSIRIEAPIPGENRIGIEVPNLKPAGISFREIFESKAWRESKAELPLLFGKNAAGKELIADLASMPHMLVAGATGQGKSVCLNSLICGLLMTRTPEQLKLIMVDPKSVEFTPYAAIPHLLVPVITDNRKVVFSLHWAVAEMEKRLKLLSRAGVKNIYDFNHRQTYTQTDMFGADTELGADLPRTLPYIVIIIDEAADLIGQCGKEVNPDIQRITQKARAAGIHMILATQRPEAKIITGAIKANIPGRVAFKTSAAIDSRTILDEAGAENLIGKGDMLFRGKDGLLVRAQGAWISDDEITRVTEFIEQHSNLQFDESFAKNLGRVKEAAIADPFAELNNEGEGDGKAEREAQRAEVKAAENASDFKKAVECVINTRRASVSHFQRQMGWGYNHAARILDELEKRGIVAPQAGAGPRQIVLDPDELVAILNEGDGTGADGAEPADGIQSFVQPNEETPA